VSFKLPYRLVGSFKGLLFVLAVGIILAVMIYTESMVSELRESSRRYLSLKVERYKMLLQQGDSEALDAYLRGMAAKDFPLILTDSTRKPLSFSGIPELEGMPRETALRKAVKYMEEWQRQGNQPVPFEMPEFGLKQYYYYGDSDQIKRLQVMPWIEVAVVGGLILIGYLGFSSIKRSEERSVWVGMARETAHQLGTPLTSLYGWMELLEERPDDPEVRREIADDLKRLSTVVDRFSQIGSQSRLQPQSLRSIVDAAAGYINRRLPQIGGTEVVIDVDLVEGLTLNVNRTLFEWALENLLKNGVEALRGKSGRVVIKAFKNNRRIIIDVQDSGCGIPRREWKNVFRPGYTTKERGWGLGMSLTKRIIEGVHGGRIYIVESGPDKGTKVRMQMRA